MLFLINSQNDCFSDEEEWVLLFNGKDLNSWIPKFSTQNVGINYRSTFQVKDGLLTIK